MAQAWISVESSIYTSVDTYATADAYILQRANVFLF